MTGWARSRRECSSGSVSAWRCSGDPSLVVLDEPTSALDPVGRHDVREIIRGLRERGATVFLNTHLLEEAEHVCDRVAVIDKGTAIATGTLDELLGRHSRVRLKVEGSVTSWWRGLEPVRSMAAARGVGRRSRASTRLRSPTWSTKLVALGGRIEAVIPEHQSLEARFLELLGER